MKIKFQMLAMMFIAAMAFSACDDDDKNDNITCLLYTSPSPRDRG